MKKLIAIALVIAALLSTIPFTAHAADTPTVKVDGSLIDFPDQQPVIRNGRTLVPVRFIAEALGYDVKWNSSTNSAVIDNGKIVMTIDSAIAEINGKSVTLDTAPTLLNDRTMVPLRIIAETLNCTVDWFAENRMIVINRKGADGSEVSVWDRLKQSELYYECTTYESDHIGCLVLKSNYKKLTDSEIRDNTNWFIRRDKTVAQQYPDYDCEIYARSFDEKTRTQIRDILMIVYPYSYEEANSIMLQTMRGEIWETIRENTAQLISGTWGTRYLDNRTVHMVAGYGLTYFGIQIDNVGYINPEKPMQLSEKTIRELTEEAKRYYPLEKYGLN